MHRLAPVWFGLCLLAPACGDSSPPDDEGVDSALEDPDTEESNGDGDGDGEPTSCHPLMLDCPVVGNTCTWDGQMFLCAPAMIALGDSCDPAMPVCIGGFCASSGMLADCPSLHCCTGFCNLDAPNCPAGLSCVDHFPDGATTPEVGACLTP